MIRSVFVRSLLAAMLALSGGLGAALAQQQRSGQAPSRGTNPQATHPQQGAASPGGGQAALLQSFGDWGAYATTASRARICYALSQPKSRSPANLKDTPGYLFVATRPAEKVRNEISLIMNFDLKEGVDHQAVIGSNQFALVAKGKNLWVKNPAEEGRMVEAMKKASEMTIKGTSAKNNATADRYSLKGFGEALDRVQKECR